MNIVRQSFVILDHPSELELLTSIERAARTCYKSEDKITEGSARAMVKKLIESGHEAMLEHRTLSVVATTDRGVSHEIVRHRLAAYAQESTRYCNYTKDKFGKVLTVIDPRPGMINAGLEHEKVNYLYSIWHGGMLDAQRRYFAMIEAGASPQIARSVLPNSLKTEIVITMDIREWRHFLKLRCSKAAHPQMRELACGIGRAFATDYPALFGDIVNIEAIPDLDTVEIAQWEPTDTVLEKWREENAELNNNPELIVKKFV